MQVLGIKNRTVNTGFTIPFEVFEKLEQARKSSYESRSHYVSRILSAHLAEEKTTTDGSQTN
jgi:metal-responsive CopG/Arc/MetJ family transcriptional regulator